MLDVVVDEIVRTLEDVSVETRVVVTHAVPEKVFIFTVAERVAVLDAALDPLVD